jgi:hypothetical protein
MNYDDLKIEMLNDNEVMGYLMEKKIVFKRNNYGNGVLEVSMKNYQSFGKLKKKFCKRYCLGIDIVITDEEKRIIDINLLIQEYDDELRIDLNNFGDLIEVKLIRTNDVIDFVGKMFEFGTNICNAWNRTFVAYYINLLIGGIQRKVEISINGVLWTESILVD